MTNSLKASMVFLGAFIGAGFASGQEIMCYFFAYGKIGALGALLSSVLFGLFCYCTIVNAKNLGEFEYNRQLNIFPFVKGVNRLFMLVLFCAMISGAGESIHSVMGINKIYGAVLVAIVSGLLLAFGSEGLIKINTFFTPIIIIGIPVVCISSIIQNTVSVMSRFDFIEASFVYVSYNTITLAAISGSIMKYIKSKHDAVMVSLIAGGILFVLIVILLSTFYIIPLELCEIPILGIASDLLKPFYLVILLLSMITTAVSNGYGFIINKKNKVMTILLICILAVTASFISFSFMINYIYRFFGYMGIIILANNFYIFVKSENKRGNRRNR